MTSSPGAADNAPLFGWALDLDHNEGPASDAFLEAVGVEARELLSWDHFLSRTPAGLRPRLQDLRERVDKGESLVLDELVLDGVQGPLHYRLQAVPVQLPASRSALFTLQCSGPTLQRYLELDVLQRLPDLAFVTLDHDLQVAVAEGGETTALGLDQPEGWFLSLPDDAQIALEGACAEAEAGRVGSLEIPIGSQYYRVFVQSLEDRWVTVWQNISENKRQSLLFEQTQAAAVVGGWELDCTNQHVYWTEESYRIHNVDSHDFQPSVAGILQFYDDKSRFALEEALLRCSTAGDSFDLKLSFMGAEKRVVRMQGRPVWKDQTVVRLFGSYQDVTERHQEQELLRRGQERTRALLKALPDMFFVLDQDGTFIEYSAPDPSLLLAPPDQITGRNIREILPELAESYFENAREAIATGKMRTMEYNVRIRDQERRFEARLVASELEKSPSLVVLVRDITERHRQEMELWKSREDAVQASKIKSQFLANMSHEIRTPLNGVIGMTDLALNTDLTPEQREYLEATLQSARSLLGIVDDILDLSKIEAGRLELESIPFSVRAIVREVLNGMALRAHEKGLELLGSVQAEVPQLVVGDPVRFRQLVTNLLSNAIKFTEKGEVEIEVAARDGGMIRVSVYDTGPGIAVERQSSIFDPFTQADGSTTRRFGGTGLGLTICRQLVEKMGGRIWLESQLGQGSRFSFTVKLPSYHVENEQGPAVALGRELLGAARMLTPDAVRSLQGSRILIVDDNASSRRVLRDQLASWGMEPVTVAGPGPAIHAVREATRLRRPFRMAIIDYQMPACNGLELAKELPDHVSRMLLTTVGRPSPEQLLDAKVAAVLAKPVAGSELAEAIVSVLISPRSEAVNALSVALSQDESGGLRILLAEDNLINAKVIMRLLEGLGYEVKHVANGALALEQLDQDGSFDLVLMDIQMPVMDGYEATRRIRAAEAAEGRHTTIVALTANAMAGDRERCLEAGMDNYLTKPIDRGKLLEVLQEVRSKVHEVASSS